MSYIVGFDLAGLILAPVHPFKMITPFQGDDFGVGSEDNGRILLDSTNQITRHAFRQPARPHEHVHAFRGLCQKHSGLADRVAAIVRQLEDEGERSQWRTEVFLGIHQGGQAEPVWEKTLGHCA